MYRFSNLNDLNSSNLLVFSSRALILIVLQPSVTMMSCMRSLETTRGGSAYKTLGFRLTMTPSSGAKISSIVLSGISIGFTSIFWESIEF